MAEKRNLGRHRKRFPLRLGIGDTIRMAFTEDISSTGLFIKTANVYNPGAVITIELVLDDSTAVRLEAQVMWAKKVPPQLIHLTKKSGMGVKIRRFINGEAEYLRLCQELDAR